MDLIGDKMVKIYTKVVYQYNSETKQYDKVSEDFEEYDGPIAHCGGGGGKDGGGGGYSPPTPPDPAATAAAQGVQDRKTAQTNALLLNPTISSPYGNIGYDVNQYTIDGDTISRPTQTTTLSPAQQAELDARNKVSGYLSQAGISLAQQLPTSPLLSPNTPARPTSIDYSGVDAAPTMAQYDQDRQNVQKSVYDQQYSLMAPELEQSRKQLENRLIQTGNPLGSEAYNTELDRYERNKNASLQNLTNSAVAQGYNTQSQLFNNANVARQQQIAAAQLPYNTANQLRGDQISEAQLLRNQQINELSALLQGREAVTTPAGAQYNQSALRSPDLAGMTQQNYQNQLGAYNTNYSNQQQNGNAMMSGLFSLGAAAVPYLF